MNGEAAVEYATALREQARAHKQAERHHRRKARTTMAELERFCLAHNITLDKDPGGHSHGRPIGS